MSTSTPAFVKALFRTFVLKDVGGVEAAGALLGVSHQRVSALISLQSADMPTVMQVVTLEQAVGRSVVFGALAEAVEGKTARGDMLREASEGVSAAAAVMSACVEEASPSEFAATAAVAIKELEDVRLVATAKAANAA
jgi:hypothetical protein